MGTPVAPPDWTLADVRGQAEAWSRDHGRPRLAGTVATAVVLAVLTGVSAGPEAGSGDVGAAIRALLTGAALGAGLGMAIGHVLAAGSRYPTHAVALPRLVSGVTRAPGSVGLSVTGIVAVTLGALLPPMAGVALGLALVLIVPTGPGVALGRALDRAADAITSEAGLPPRGARAVATAVLLAGAGTAVIAALRVLWSDGADCGLAWFGVPCGQTSVVLLTVAGSGVAWFTIPVGAAIARSLDVALGLGSAGAPAHVGGAPVADDAATATAVLERDDLDELVDLVRARFSALSAETRTDVVTLVSRTLDEDVEIGDGEDVLDTLEDAIRTAGPDETVDAIGTLHEHVGTIGSLRSRYQRTPKLARGAIEKTAATAVRTAGVPREVAGPAVRTLLTMPDEDWATVTATLDEVTTRFAAAPA